MRKAGIPDDFIMASVLGVVPGAVRPPAGDANQEEDESDDKNETPDDE
jgi:hypothetical protein